MASEIERKFLVKSKEWFSFKKPKPLFIKQAFVLQQDKKVLRARIKADKGFLTIKGKVLVYQEWNLNMKSQLKTLRK